MIRSNIAPDQSDISYLIDLGTYDSEYDTELGQFFARRD